MTILLGYVCFGLMLAFFFGPLDHVKNKIANKIWGRDLRPKWIEYFWCSKCVTFWATLALSTDVFLACSASVIAYILDNVIRILESL